MKALAKGIRRPLKRGSSITVNGKILKLGNTVFAPGVIDPPCCPLARRVTNAPFCVCMCITYCPEHGTKHVGTHD